MIMAQLRRPEERQLQLVRDVTLSRYHASLLEIKWHMFAKLLFSNLVEYSTILKNGKCTVDRFSVFTLSVIVRRIDPIQTNWLSS